MIGRQSSSAIHLGWKMPNQLLNSVQYVAPSATSTRKHSMKIVFDNEGILQRYMQQSALQTCNPVIPVLSHAQPLCNPYCFSAVISFTHSAMLVVVSGLPPINITGFLNRVTCMYLHFLDSFYNNTVSSLFQFV